MKVIPRTKRWRRGSLSGLVLIALLVAIYFVPSIYLRSVINDWLARQGLNARGLDDIHINIYSGSLQTDTLTLVKTDTDQPLVYLKKLALDLRFAPLTQGRIDVGGTRLTGLDLDLVQQSGGGFIVKGLPLPDTETQTEPVRASPLTFGGWLLGFSRVEIEDTRIGLQLDGLEGDLLIERAVLNTLKSWQPDQSTVLFAEGSLNGSPVSLELHVKPFRNKPEAEYQLVIREFPLETVNLGIPLRGTVSIRSDGKVTTDGDYGNANGTLTAAVDTEGLGMELQSNGGPVTAITDTHASRLEASVRDNSIKASGTTTASGVTVSMPDDITLARVGVLEIGDWSWRGDRITATGASLQSGTLVSKPGQTLTAFEAVTINNFAASLTGDITAGDISLHGANASLTLAEDGIVELMPLDPWLKGTIPDESSPDESTRSETPLRIAVDEVRFADTAHLDFTDTTLYTPVSYELIVDTLSLRDIDTADPARQSPLQFAAAIGESGKIDINGWVAPFRRPAPGFDLVVNVNNLELPRASPYAAAYLGIHLNRGQLTLEANGRSDAGTLAADTKWIIQRIELAQLENYEQKQLSRQIDVPISTAVNLLQDRDGNIELDVPISGQLNSPSFDLSNAVSQAIGQAMRGALLASIKIAFPVVALADLVIRGGEVNLKPVVFAPLDSQPERDARDYIASLGELLVKRPNVAISTCGIAVFEDFRALRAENLRTQAAKAQELAGYPLEAEQTNAESADPGTENLMEPPMDPAERQQLQSLAEERAARVEQILREDHDIGAERLFDCRSTIASEDKGRPRVKVTL